MTYDKRVVVICISIIFLFSCEAEAVRNINAKIARLNMDRATRRGVVRLFGKPAEYRWRNQTFKKNNLPPTYIMFYPDGFRVVMSNGRVNELRHEGDDGYVFHGRLRYGSSLKEVLEVIGQPRDTIVGQPLPSTPKDGVLYKDIDGRDGYCYYLRSDQCVRIFFGNYKVTALYTTCNDSYRGGGRSFRAARPLPNRYEDVRDKDISKFALSGKSALISTLTFNEKTIWPKPWMAGAYNPKKLMTKAMNPGLGIRLLHKRGITGRGVNVAIIDQPLHLDHPEYAGKIVAYHDVGCGTQSSVHGPAVASLLVGTNCGTAPDARVYYAAAPSWTKDAAYQAQALDWIIEQNAALSPSEKIRVVSVSAAPSGPGSPFDKNNQMWDEACARAEAADILVLDCTGHRGFIGRCWYDGTNRESTMSYEPGAPEQNYVVSGRLLVPTAPRTTAEQYQKGQYGYIYWGRGGLSWGIPYCAGVLALGWQIRPDLGPEQMRELLSQSAFEKRNGIKIINPRRFIRLVEKAKAP